MVKITTSNCNFWLTKLYKERDYISYRIDTIIVAGGDPSKFEKEYQEKCDEIDKFIEFRHHHDCLLEGDPGYGPV